MIPQPPADANPDKPDSSVLAPMVTRRFKASPVAEAEPPAAENASPANPWQRVNRIRPKNPRVPFDKPLPVSESTGKNVPNSFPRLAHRPRKRRRHGRTAWIVVGVILLLVAALAAVELLTILKFL